MLESNSLTGVLAFFFYEHRYLSMPGLGRLELSGDSSPETDDSHSRVFPQGSISFIPNPLEKPDPLLVEYITSRTRKMEALATADLNSTSDLAREMLNMRQSYTFSGIATITPGSRGNFIVTPEKLLPTPYYSGKQPAGEKYRHEDKEPLLQDKEIHSAGERRTFGGAIIAIICVLIVVVLVYFLFQHKETNSRRVAANAEDTIVQRADSPSIVPHPPVKTAVPDTPAENRQNAVLTAGSLLHYEVVFEQADSARAFRRYNQLTGWGHKIIMKKEDSIHYTLAVPFTGAAADTTAVKDSMQIFYGRPVYIRYISSK